MRAIHQTEYVDVKDHRLSQEHVGCIAIISLSCVHVVLTELEVVSGNFQQVTVRRHHRLDGLSEEYIYIIIM